MKLRINAGQITRRSDVTSILIMLMVSCVIESDWIVELPLVGIRDADVGYCSVGSSSIVCATIVM